MPATTDSRIQPIVSSIIPDAKVIWLMSRLMTFISIITLAITGMAEMPMAVPMKRAKRRQPPMPLLDATHLPWPNPLTEDV
jgi:hypothetical protein